MLPAEWVRKGVLPELRGYRQTIRGRLKPRLFYFLFFYFLIRNLINPKIKDLSQINHRIWPPVRRCEKVFYFSVWRPGDFLFRSVVTKTPDRDS